MIQDILASKQCFKLVCGAGNEDAQEVKRLVALYSTAGCTLFDLCAKPEIVKAAKEGLEYAGIKQDRYLCVSLGIKGDPHVSKARINQETCVSCKACVNICPRYAIMEENLKFQVRPSLCIGCQRCISVCPTKSIFAISTAKEIKEVLPDLIAMGIDCIELHAIGESDEEIINKWQDISDSFKGMLSCCLDRSKLGNERIVARIRKLIGDRENFTTIIQTDGAPMSGGNDDYKTTLQAVAHAEIIQNAKLPVFIVLSGGTNSKSAELAKICGISPHGVAIGSYARQIVKQYIERDDFLENKEIFNQALTIAKNLVNKILKDLR